MIEQVVQNLGYECWGFSFNNHKMRAKLTAFIDRAEGVTLADCGLVNSRIKAALDDSDLLNCPYTLEVSSPGIERSLFKLSQFRDYKGQVINLKCWAPINGRRNFRGVIGSVDKETFTLRTQEEEITVTMEQVRSAKLFFPNYEDAFDNKGKLKSGKHE